MYRIKSNGTGKYHLVDTSENRACYKNGTDTGRRRSRMYKIGTKVTCLHCIAIMARRSLTETDIIKSRPTDPHIDIYPPGYKGVRVLNMAAIRKADDNQ